MLWFAAIVLGVAGLSVLDDGGRTSSVPWWVGLILLAAAIGCAVADRVLPARGCDCEDDDA